MHTGKGSSCISQTIRGLSRFLGGAVHETPRMFRKPFELESCLIWCQRGRILASQDKTIIL